MVQHTRDEVIGTLRREVVQELRATIRHHQGKQALDMRYFILNDLGQWMATPRGITVPIEQLPDLGKMLRKLFLTVKAGHDGKKGGADGV
jgi:hypothetical protein